jgi:hypothetical protein
MRVAIDLAVIAALSLVSFVRLPGLGEDAPGSLHPDLVSIWPEQRPYAAHAARTILEQANIFVLLRGIHHRTCLQFFGPYVPIDIMVPAAYADQAVSLVNGVLDERYESS